MSLSPDAEDAVQRLVRSVVGKEDANATALARRLMSSSIGSSRPQRSFSSSLRRIERSRGKECRDRVEEQCNRLKQHLEDNVAEQAVAVLTKLQGNKHRVMEPSFVRTTASSKPTTHLPSPSSQSGWASLDDTATTAAAKLPTPSNLRGLEETIMKVEKACRDERLYEEALAEEEGLILRECLYSLQGIDGERVSYHWRKQQGDASEYEGVRVHSLALTAHRTPETMASSRLGSGARDVIRICGETGWLYQRIRSYVKRLHTADGTLGVVSRAFAGALSNELQDYHSLLVHLESKLPETTLRQLLVDLRMPTSRLKILAMLTDGLASLSGGHLLAALHLHSLHGDTRHANLVRSLLYAASRPWFDILYLWTTQGILSDPFQDFFVTQVDHTGRDNLWKHRYRIEQGKIPTGILELKLVEPIFAVGKGINFIRSCLLDGDWVLQLTDEGTKPEDDTNNKTTDVDVKIRLGYHYSAGDSRTLEKTLAVAADKVHTHILQSLREDHHLMIHLFALKQFLFLGQGDFFSILMDSLHAEFENRQGIDGIFKHTLYAAVDGALRSTNAKDMPHFVLERLRVELLDETDSSAHFLYRGDDDDQGVEISMPEKTGWDIFMLTYKIPESDPLNTVVSPDALEQYKGVFSFLFALNRVEYMLNLTWRQSATLQHALQTLAQNNALARSSSPGYAQAITLLRKISMTRQSVMHFVINLKSYLMFEVFEGGWKDLVYEIEAAKTLDQVIAAHDAYLESIVRKCLLTSDLMGGNDISEQLRLLLAVASDFCALQQKTFNESLEAAERAAEARRIAERREKEGRWGFGGEDSAEEETFFGLADPSKLTEVIELSEAFNQYSLELLGALDVKVNGGSVDEVTGMLSMSMVSMGGNIKRRVAEVNAEQGDLDSLRFLTFQLNHNNYFGSISAGR